MGKPPSRQENLGDRALRTRGRYRSYVIAGGKTKYDVGRKAGNAERRYMGENTEIRYRKDAPRKGTRR